MITVRMLQTWYWQKTDTEAYEYLQGQEYTARDDDEDNYLAFMVSQGQAVDVTPI